MSWNTFNQSLVRYPHLAFSMDLSLMNSMNLEACSGKVNQAFEDMRRLERGEVVNVDEGRMVGHYWLRNSSLAPTEELKSAIDGPIEQLKQFAAHVHSGKVLAPSGARYKQILLIGIGGSALGPQFVAEALAAKAQMPLFFFDNTDPAGMDVVLTRLQEQAGLSQTLVLVISKSGGTAETRNGMLEAKVAWEAAGLDFGLQAVAITGRDSLLDRFAVEHHFVARFPMEDWVGGRTSLLSTVGLVPAALQGLNIDDLLAGAAAMDHETRREGVTENAAMRLALAWYQATNGRGEKAMVVLPYKDSLVLFSKYLQQLVMESLGKKLDLDGKVVNQGLTVYGNKGSTDQHAYVQQLRDGVDHFFAVFIEVREGRDGGRVEVEPGVTSADFLQGFLRGTRKALSEAGRQSITLSIPQVNEFTLGMLIALFERAVSFYASLIHVNAYHQPGVEAGKKAAGLFLKTLSEVRAAITADPVGAEAMAATLGADVEEIYHCLNHLVANDRIQVSYGRVPAEDVYWLGV